MRPEKAHSEVRKAIYLSLKDGKTIHIKKVKKEINKLHSAQKRDLNEYFNKIGYEGKLYNYDVEGKGVKPRIETLENMSDRFMSHSNLEWLRGISNDIYDEFEGGGVIKYCAMGDYLLSEEGASHYISSQKVIQLNRVNPKECVIALYPKK